jgi:cellobionic acid phosphorylase
LTINPQMPAAWQRMDVEREFRGARFHVHVERADVKSVLVRYEGKFLPEPRVTGIVAGAQYRLDVFVP